MLRGFEGCETPEDERDRLREEVRQLRAKNEIMLKALMTISMGAGTYSRDKLTFATNVIDEMKGTAKGAIREVNSK